MDGNTQINRAADDNIIDLKTGAPVNTDRQAEQKAGKRPYQAYEADETREGKGIEEWFRLHYQPDGPPDSVEMCRYIDILKVYCPIQGALLITCEDVSFVMEGQNLADDIPTLIQDRKLRALYLYKPEEHLEPSTGEPVIYSVERTSILDADI